MLGPVTALVMGPHASLCRKKAEDADPSLRERGSRRGVEVLPCYARLSAPELRGIRGLGDVSPSEFALLLKLRISTLRPSRFWSNGGTLSVAGGGVGNTGPRLGETARSKWQCKYLEFAKIFSVPGGCLGTDI